MCVQKPITSNIPWIGGRCLPIASLGLQPYRRFRRTWFVPGRFGDVALAHKATSDTVAAWHDRSAYVGKPSYRNKKSSKRHTFRLLFITLLLSLPASLASSFCAVAEDLCICSQHILFRSLVPFFYMSKKFSAYPLSLLWIQNLHSRSSDLADLGISTGKIGSRAGILAPIRRRRRGGTRQLSGLRIGMLVRAGPRPVSFTFPFVATVPGSVVFRFGRALLVVLGAVHVFVLRLLGLIGLGSERIDIVDSSRRRCSSSHDGVDGGVASVRAGPRGWQKDHLCRAFWLGIGWDPFPLGGTGQWRGLPGRCAQAGVASLSSSTVNVARPVLFTLTVRGMSTVGPA